jgi:DNA recombination protein RmuC
LPSAPDFVVMFLPGETFFSAALQQDPGLIEYGVNQRVIPASPTTLIALLQAVAYGWRQEKIAESAQEISARGKELYERLSTLAGHVRELGGTLGRSVEHYNDAIASLETRVLVTARKFPELGVSAKKEIPELAPIEKSVRQLQSMEFVTSVKLADLAAVEEEKE